jgi:hypothetical protein
MRRFIKGTKVDFVEVFYDKEGEIAVPQTATLYIRQSNGQPNWAEEPTEIEIPMNLNTTVEPNQWEASWNTAGHRGLVFWSVISSDPNLTTDEGKFKLQANPATRIATRDLNAVT